MKNNFFLCGELTASSPVAIGGGTENLSDHDIWLDENGRPLIPGTSLAGVCRHYLMDSGKPTDDLFGNIGKNEQESRIVFYDAPLNDNGRFRRSFRDGVRIDENGVAEDTGKFDYEVVETEQGAYFRFRLEINGWDEERDHARVDAIVNGFNSGRIRVGYKSARGLGSLELKNVRYMIVSTVKELLDFTWDKVSLQYKPAPDDNAGSVFVYHFDVASFLTVANNATNKSKNDGGVINSEPMKNAAKKPVVPGSSWAGVFRHHFARILTDTGYEGRDKYLNCLFGSTEQASRIAFGESVVNNAICLDRTRNAIDRFTGGAGDKKLFTDEASFGGQLTLTITLSDKLSDEERKLAENLIRITVRDIDGGYVNIGKLGAIGGGQLREVKK